MTPAIAQKNIYLLYALKWCTWFSVSLSVLLPFYQSFGLTTADFFLIQSFFSFAIVAFEFPTGYFADRVGHKTSLIIGCAFGALSWVMHALSGGFYSLLASEIVLALAIACRSGADSALLFESMKYVEGGGGTYKRAENRITMIGSAAEASGAILGGFLVLISVTFPFWFRVGMEVLASLCAYALVQPPSIPRPQRHLFSDIAFIITYTATHPQLRATMLFSAVTGASTLTAVWFVQPYLSEMNMPLYWYGIIWAVFNASIVLFSWIAEQVELILGESRTLLVLAFLPASAFVLLGLVPASVAVLPLFFVFYFVRSLNVSFGRAYIQEHALSEARATILSVQSQLFRIIFAVIGPVAGWFATAHSLSAALLFSGFCFVVLALGSYVLFTRSRDVSPA